jgi:hypothetical protein
MARCAPAERHLQILVTVASNSQLPALAVGVALQCMRLLLAQSGHRDGADGCPLLGVKRTSLPRQLGEVHRDAPRT